VWKFYAREPGEPIADHDKIESGYVLGIRKEKPTMNGNGQSDSEIVPVKWTNKERKLSAEFMEGNELTKRDELQQNTLLTQCLTSVSHALYLMQAKARSDYRDRPFCFFLSYSR
jgi:hypothetical protein